MTAVTPTSNEHSVGGSHSTSALHSRRKTSSTGPAGRTGNSSSVAMENSSVSDLVPLGANEGNRSVPVVRAKYTKVTLNRF